MKSEIRTSTTRFYSLFLPSWQQDYSKDHLGFPQTEDGWSNYLGFLLLCEIIFDVERLPDLLWGFALDHVGHSLAGDI